MSAMSEYVDRQLATQAWLDAETVEQLRAARAAGVSQKALAAQYRVTQNTIHRWLLTLGLAGMRARPRSRDGHPKYDHCACGTIKRYKARQCRICYEQRRRTEGGKW
jgi:hypothetical protein